MEKGACADQPLLPIGFQSQLEIRYHYHSPIYQLGAYFLCNLFSKVQELGYLSYIQSQSHCELDDIQILVFFCFISREGELERILPPPLLLYLIQAYIQVD